MTRSVADTDKAEKLEKASIPFDMDKHTSSSALALIHSVGVGPASWCSEPGSV